MTDHSETIAGVAARIANQLRKGETIQYGPAFHEHHNMASVQEFLLKQDALCSRFDKIHLGFMFAVEDPDKAVEWQIKMDELTLDAIGEFAESPGVASRVHSFEVDNAAHYE